MIRPFGNGEFAHRTAWKGLYYEKQKESKIYRALGKSKWALEQRLDDLRWELYHKRPKYQKTHYKGKPTPKYQKLQQLEARYEQATNEALLQIKGVRRALGL